MIVHLKVKSLSSSASPRFSKPTWFSFFCQTRDLWQDVHADHFLIIKVNGVLSSSRITVKGVYVTCALYSGIQKPCDRFRETKNLICYLLKIFPSFIALKSHVCVLNMQICICNRLWDTWEPLVSFTSDIVWHVLTYLPYFNYNLL